MCLFVESSLGQPFFYFILTRILACLGIVFAIEPPSKQNTQCPHKKNTATALFTEDTVAHALNKVHTQQRIQQTKSYQRGKGSASPRRKTHNIIKATAASARLFIHTPLTGIMRHLLIALLLIALVSIGASAQSYTAKLVGGREDRNRFGDLLNYYIYAEERAIVSPFPAYELYRNGQFFPIYEPLVVPTHKEKKAFYPNSSLTYTRSVSRSITGQHRRDSTLQWSILSRPEGSQVVTGTNPIIAEKDNKFTFRDWVFDFNGRYNVLFEARLWNGDYMRFNRSITVDPQPSHVRLTSAPEGYNGTALSPMPTVQLVNLIEQKIKTSTAIITFVIISGPPGGENTGAAVYSTNKDGACELNRVILSLPGTYVYQIEAKLTSGDVLRTAQFSLVVEKALPTRIELVTSPYGISQFLLFSQPKFRVYDQKGIVHDDRTNITLIIGSNSPSFSYENQMSHATLMGTTSVLPSSYDYTFTDLWLDMPGSYGIEAILFLDGFEHMSLSFYVTVDSPPTFLIPTPLQVNSIGNVTIYGNYPKVRVALPTYFAMSSDSDCKTVDSSVLLWNESFPSNIAERSVQIVPYAQGTMHMCMKTATQNHFTKLIQMYQQRYTEAFPYVDRFSVADVSECKAIGGMLAAMYASVGWRDVVEGRRYGCKLSPPVAGTIAPCTCPATLRCATYTHKLFTPPNLDIGQCVCCTEWVLGLAGTAASLALVAVLAIIYFYV